jgi:hypothetical protein
MSTGRPASKQLAGPGTSAACLALLITACHQTISLELPASGDDGTLIVSLASEEGPKTTHVFELPGPVAAPEFAGAGDLELLAAEYACSPGTLGLSKGWQSPKNEPSAAIRLPPARRFSTSRVEDGALTAWSEEALSSSKLDALVKSLDLPGDNLCRIYSPEVLPRPTLGEFPSTDRQGSTFALHLPDDTILIGTQAAELIHIEANRQMTVLSTTTPALAAYQAPDEDIWLVEASGRVQQGDPLRGFEAIEVETATPAENRIALAGPPAGHPFELYLVNDRGSFARWANGAWEQILEGDGALLPVITWMEPGKVAVVGATGGRKHLAVYDNGSITELDLPSPDARVESMTRVPGYGLVIGTNRGIYIYDGASMSELEQGEGSDQPTANARFIWPSGSGFRIFRFQFRPRGYLFYHPAAGFCDFTLSVGALPEWVLPRDDGSFIIVTFVLEGPVFRIFDFELEPPLDCVAGAAG